MCKLAQLDYLLQVTELQAWSLSLPSWENEDGFMDSWVQAYTPLATYAFTVETTPALFAHLHQWGQTLLDTHQPQRITFQVGMEGQVTLAQLYAMERICGALCVSANQRGIPFYDQTPVLEATFQLWTDDSLLAQGSYPPRLAVRN